MSDIRFSGLAGRTWTPKGGYEQLASYNADVYVFCVHTAKSHQEYDPLDVAQWDFYVLTRREVVGINYKSIGLRTISVVAGSAMPFRELAKRITEAFERQRNETEPVG